MGLLAGSSGSVPGGGSGGAQVPKQTQEKMELNFSTCQSGPLLRGYLSLEVAWAALGLAEHFLGRAAPHPILEMVLAG